jgi:RNA polymerase sigma-70 factor (ECF subfamily)
LTQPTDEELIAAIGRGDRAAQKEFFERFRQTAFRTAYRMLGNEPDALDAASGAFVKAFRSAHSFRGTSAARTWFYRVVANTCLDIRREKRRNLSLDTEIEEGGTLGDFVKSDTETPPEESLRGELSVKISEAIGKLDEKHRSVFVLAAVEEMSYKEIAQVLGLSMGTVMSRLFYARKYLQKSLRKHTGAQT